MYLDWCSELSLGSLRLSRDFAGTSSTSISSPLLRISSNRLLTSATPILSTADGGFPLGVPLPVLSVRKGASLQGEEEGFRSDSHFSILS